MVYGHRYIQVEKSGRVSGSCADPVEGATVDTKGVDVPEMPTDAIYALYYNEEKGLYYVKVAELEPEEPTQLDQLQADIAYLKMKKG